MPPMQISAIEPATAQRVARLKTNNATSNSTSTPSTSSSRSTSTSRLTSQTASSMQKQSDASLRSTRNQLPTIAGSPSVGTTAHASKEPKELPPPASLNTSSGYSKETPTKIPRISSRSSAIAASPPLKVTSSTVNNRRQSTLSTSRNTSPSTNEFGVIEASGDQPSSVVKSRASPSVVAAPRLPRQASQTSSNSGSTLPRKSNRESISFTGLRKASTGSVHGTSTASTSEASTSHHRFSGLSPSKGLKLLSPKISLSATRSSNSSSTQNIHQTLNSPSSSRQSLSTPSPVPSSVDDEEALGDEEMLMYIKRQHAKKLAAGATQEELDEMLKFPEPIAPAEPVSPTGKLGF
jgi:dual specificity tyrosine-phosphorylation-regulated kinase 2/3/4